ncbi:MFS transporter [Mucilaginibacter sp. RS28]|uniref:MFS transporter n=1 Tax=Mucilaginibacter straminoryzae TaxID=2932774 RepID=A0A9X1X398_9SPHI|nr:MFS transporter [Mucilaginibacter straminoryzae]MCJ8210354.1 MFS transporter [Mucilaginibacter straminoryzae]
MKNNHQGNYEQQLTPLTLWVMTITTCLVVANIYYNQPLLNDIAQDFKVSTAKAGQVSMYTQMGYAAGLLFIVPLADMLQRKKLMLIDFALIIASLLAIGFSKNIILLYAASFLVGLSSVIPQLLIPMVAHLAKPSERGKKIGFVQSGLLIGILLSRTISGFAGAHFGWRSIFYIAAGLMVVLWFLVYRLLPEIEPSYHGKYGSLMKSLIDIFKEEPKLRLAAFRGALCFAAFSAFWSTLIFLLRLPQFNEGSDVAGLFGLVGAFGAIAVGFMGRLSDKMDAYKLSTFTILLLVISFIVFFFSGSSFIGLVIGVILMDMGVQATHISNQTIIFSLNPAARNRINTVYMVSYFVGGSLGTLVATQLWGSYGWNGVCAIGTILSVIVLIVQLLNHKNMTVSNKTVQQ